MRDFQKSKVYRWEKQTLWYDAHNWRLDTLDECHLLVEKIWLREGLRKPHPKLGDGRGRRTAVSLGGEIKLPRYFRNAVVICHEIAHEMLPKGTGHTEDFVSTFINVLHNNLDLPKDELVTSALDFRIKMNHNLL
jgi:hypothetical protein